MKYNVGDVIVLTIKKDDKENLPLLKRLITAIKGDKYTLLYPNDEFNDLDIKMVDSFYTKIDEPFVLNNGKIIEWRHFSSESVSRGR